ncbi:PREDICTED: uncharacterized protein C20orf173 homolog [Miniopterus natalensis]|uniref:uncharacterized protein C20orf173 homolog n=1 Tax=Miniopterus natalensis TaxID=291302 RepID=UPI0007A6C113|nr:PREDICTED: uncharacterized protein C20orf173 homolog [Miniopterus natalensis]
MRCMWQIFVLWVFWVLILCLMVPCLDRKPEPAPQEKLTYLVPWRGNCLWFKFRKCGCPSGSLNYSLCHHTVREQNWFDACYEKTMGYLMRTTESVTPDAVLWWLGMNSASELGKVWEKLFKVIARPSVSHNDLYCGTCVLVGNSKVLRASGLSNNVTQHTTVFRNVGVQGSWRQLLLLLLKLSGLAWTSDALSQEDARFGFVSEKQGKWEDINQNMHSTETEMEVSKNVWWASSPSTADALQSPHKS